MLFFKPLSVHSRSIMWRPEKKKNKEEKGERETERESCYVTKSILAVQENVIELG